MASELERRTLRRISWRIVPFIMLLYFIAFIDRVNIGFAALTMNKDLGFSPTVFGFGAGIFFLGYFLFEVPSNIILDRVGARLWIARVMVTWGIISAAFAFIQGETSFYILRFLLGVAEAGFFPGIILYLSYWFPARRRAQVVSFFMAAAPISMPQQIFELGMRNPCVRTTRGPGPDGWFTRSCTNERALAGPSTPAHLRRPGRAQHRPISRAR